MTQKKTRTLSLLAAITADVIFGMSFMFSKLALGGGERTVLLASRVTGAEGGVWPSGPRWGWRP